MDGSTVQYSRNTRARPTRSSTPLPRNTRPDCYYHLCASTPPQPATNTHTHTHTPAPAP